MPYSNSQIQDDKGCPRLGTHNRTHQKQAGRRAVMGTATHDAFAMHYGDGKSLMEALDITLAKPRFGNDFYGADANILDAEEGLEIRKWLQNWSHPIPEGSEIIDIEQRKTFTYDGVEFSVQQDIVYRAPDGILTNRDWKSGFSSYDTENSPQGALYGMALALEHFEDVVRFEHALVTQNKLQVTTWTMEQLQEMVHEHVLIAKRIEADPNNQDEVTGIHCQYCPLRSDCDTFKASLELQDAPDINDEEAYEEHIKRVKGIYKAFEAEYKRLGKPLKKRMAESGENYAGFKLGKGSREYHDLEAVLLRFGAPVEFSSIFKGQSLSGLGKLVKLAEARDIDLSGTSRRYYFDKLEELK